jgi:hypothetical protein
MALNPLDTAVVQPAAIAVNAASEWNATDLTTTPAFNLIGCFQDGTSFTAPRRLKRRLHVARSEDLGVLEGAGCWAGWL